MNEKHALNRERSAFDRADEDATPRIPQRCLECRRKLGDRFSWVDGFTLNVVQKGECWLSIKDQHEKIRLRAGDCFLLTGGKVFTLATSFSLKKRFRAEQLFCPRARRCCYLSGRRRLFRHRNILRFEGHLPSLLFRRLPPVIHIDGNSDEASILRWNLERFGAELRSGGVGRALMLSHIAPIMLLQTLRIYLASAKNERTGSSRSLTRGFRRPSKPCSRTISGTGRSSSWQPCQYVALWICTVVQEESGSRADGLLEKLADTDCV